MYIRYTDDEAMNDTIQCWLDNVVSIYDIIRPLKENHYSFIFNRSNKRNLSELDVLYTYNLN